VSINYISGTDDRLRCCQRRWTVRVVNWSWSPVYHTDCQHLCTTWWAWGTASVCQQQQRLVELMFLHPTKHKIGHYGDVLPSQPLALLLKNQI